MDGPVSDLQLPFPGPLTVPPKAALWLAIGGAHGQRQRVATDANGEDCNDYAYDAVQNLQREGRKPYYVSVINEAGQGHMIAAYATQDGTLYARDNRVAGGDIPLQRLVDKGYSLVAAADPSAQLWHSLVPPAAAPAAANTQTTLVSAPSPSKG
jgi:hypothetical protein